MPAKPLSRRELMSAVACAGTATGASQTAGATSDGLGGSRLYDHCHDPYDDGSDEDLYPGRDDNSEKVRLDVTTRENHIKESESTEVQVTITNLMATDPHCDNKIKYQVAVDVPTGFAVTSVTNVEAGGTTYTSTMEVGGGESKTASLTLQGVQPGDWDLEAKVQFWSVHEDGVVTWERTEHITVLNPDGTAPNSGDDTSGTQDSGPVFTNTVVGILFLLMIAVLGVKSVIHLARLSAETS